MRESVNRESLPAATVPAPVPTLRTAAPPRPKLVLAATSVVAPVPPLATLKVPPRLVSVKLASTTSTSISLLPVSSVMDTLLDPALIFFNSMFTPDFCLYTPTPAVPMFEAVLVSPPAPPVTQLNPPEPSVDRNCPGSPSVDGRVRV